MGLRPPTALPTAPPRSAPFHPWSLPIPTPTPAPQPVCSLHCSPKTGEALFPPPGPLGLPWGVRAPPALRPQQGARAPTVLGLQPGFGCQGFSHCPTLLPGTRVRAQGCPFFQGTPISQGPWAQAPLANPPLTLDIMFPFTGFEPVA